MKVHTFFGVYTHWIPVTAALVLISSSCVQKALLPLVFATIDVEIHVLASYFFIISTTIHIFTIYTTFPDINCYSQSARRTGRSVDLQQEMMAFSKTIF